MPSCALLMLNLLYSLVFALLLFSCVYLILWCFFSLMCSWFFVSLMCFVVRNGCYICFSYIILYLFSDMIGADHNVMATLAAIADCSWCWDACSGRHRLCLLVIAVLYIFLYDTCICNISVSQHFSALVDSQSLEQKWRNPDDNSHATLITPSHLGHGHGPCGKMM